MGYCSMCGCDEYEEVMKDIEASNYEGEGKVDILGVMYPDYPQLVEKWARDERLEKYCKNVNALRID